MTMNADTLFSALNNLTPSGNETVAALSLSAAYGSLAAEASTVSGVLITPTGVARGVTAMAAALTGMSGTDDGLTIIPNAIISFWAAVAAGLADTFPEAIAIVPPPHATLLNEFRSLMSDNANSSKSKSLGDLSNLLTSQAKTGGLVTLPGSAASPII